jgi:signal transduction histidine kinase
MPEGNELAQCSGVGNETVECVSLRKLRYVRRLSRVRSANALVLERLRRPPKLGASLFLAVSGLTPPVGRWSRVWTRVLTKNARRRSDGPTTANGAGESGPLEPAWPLVRSLRCQGVRKSRNNRSLMRTANVYSGYSIAIENVRLFESVEARTRELAASLDNLRTAQDRLVQTQKLASLGQLTAGIAHEIKNPLNFVNNFSGLSTELIDELQDSLKGLPIDQKARAEINELTDTLRGNLEKVVQHGKRADSIVKNMLLHSREGSGEHRPVDINALVEESLNLAYHGARAEKQGFNITMERSLDPTAGEADVFPQEITRALLNLISNGFYAATKRKTQAGNDGYEPTLAASTRSLGDEVEIRIRDNGTGIPPEVKEKIFNPFFTTKPAGEGTGLGLSISHDIIVKQHGGTIEVDTQLGEFTEIRIILPRAAMLPTERV